MGRAALTGRIRWDGFWAAMVAALLLAGCGEAADQVEPVTVEEIGSGEDLAAGDGTGDADPGVGSVGDDAGGDAAADAGESDEKGISGAAGGDVGGLVERIVFTRYGRYGDRDISVVGADGGGLWSVTDGMRATESPASAVWSPDASRIAATFQGQVYVMDSDGGNRVMVADGGSGQPVWSPDASRIAFFTAGMEEEAGVQLVVVDADGGNRVVVAGGDEVHWWFRWSPDSTRIAFAGRRESDASQEIYIVDVNGHGSVRVTDNDVEDGLPVWSPDGASLAFYESPNRGEAQVIVADADGGNPRQLSRGEGGHLGLLWSPDSSRLAFRSYREAEVLVATRDGAGLTVVGYSDSRVREPAWSPDSSRLLFEGYPEDPTWDLRDLEVLVVNADGSHLRKLAGEDRTFDPVWSPGGDHTAFCRTGSLWMADAHGGNQAQLTDDTTGCRGPVWSPDGSKIAFSGVNSGDIDSEVLVVDVDDRTVKTLSANNYPDSGIVWSPDSNQILFTTEYGSDIFVMDPDGGSQTPLTGDNAPSYGPISSPDGMSIAFKRHNTIFVMDANGDNLLDTHVSPETEGISVTYIEPWLWDPIIHDPGDFEMAWSPDGTRIAYTDNNKLGVLDPEAGTSETIVDKTQAEHDRWDYITDVAWSPDGDSIAYVNSVGDRFQIRTVNPESGETNHLTATGSWKGDPTWSPDGTQLAYVADGRIMVTDPDGENSRQLTDTGAFNREPAWSPDGQRIAFLTRYRDGQDYEISVVDADGENPQRLTDNDYAEYQVGWSPDSKKLIFISYRDGDWEVFTMDADGQNLRQLTDNHYHDYQPTWTSTTK